MRRKKTSVTFNDLALELVRKAAEQEGRTVSQIIERLIIKELNKEPKQ